MAVVVGRSTRSLAVINMRRWRLLLFIIAVALSDANAEFPRTIGTWKYSGFRSSVSLRLVEDGTCHLTSLRLDGTAIIIPCLFTVEEGAILLERKLKTDGEAVVPARLFYDMLEDAFVVDREPYRALQREKEER